MPTINLPNDRRFVISTDGLADANRYIQSVTLNGRPLDQAAPWRNSAWTRVCCAMGSHLLTRPTPLCAHPDGA